MHDAKEIGVELPTCLVDTGVLDGSAQADACIVYQHINAAGLGDHLSSGLLHRRVIGHIERQHAHCARVSGRLAAGAEHDMADRRKMLGHRPPEPGRRAGDENDLAGPHN
jgi:hypothetical protein